MILLFPNFDTLRLCLTSSTVPPDVTLAEASVSFDANGNIYLEPSVDLSVPTRKLLDRIGVKGSKRHGSATAEKVSSWLEVLPVAKESGTPTLSAQTAVLFELDSASDLPQLVTEMLRLGNDRQSVRWIASANGPDGKRALLRVIGPPYYSLLRALDKSPTDSANAVRAYLERSPRVWVEIGYSHPFASQIRIADDRLVLIRQPREWLFLDDAPFQDVYEILQFKLPAAPVEWTEAKTPKKLHVPLRLTAGNATDVPELWVLRDDAVNRLDRLVRDADERLTQRLTFAVATDREGKQMVVLRTRPSKLPPPELPLDAALGFKPFWKLPNLFLPSGRRLHPTMRRDSVRKLLADEPDSIVWLYPDGANGFTPESIRDSAFRPLEDWVDYIIEAEQAPLAAWIDATRFDFDTFICKDTGPRNKPDKGDREPRGNPEVEPTAVKADSPPSRGPRSKAGSRSTPTNFSIASEDAKPLSKWKLKLDELERQFMAVEGGLDAPERQSLWPELARANARLNSQTEASLCWLNALWDRETLPTEWLHAWVRSEFPHADDSLNAIDFDQRLSSKSTKPADARALVAAFLWLAQQTPVPAWLPPKLSLVQKFLNAHENALPVRAVWLMALRLVQLSGSDVLGLARMRDRLLQRLLEQGMTPERDIPNFLRYAGIKDADRLRSVREKGLELHRKMRSWIEKSAETQRNNDGILRSLPYVDLLFAFALAKLGELTESNVLVAAAEKAMVVPIPEGGDYRQNQLQVAAIVQNHLFKSYRIRIAQAQGVVKGIADPSLEVNRDLEALKASAREGATNNDLHHGVYAIERMQKESLILEPIVKLDPYRNWSQVGDPLRRELMAFRQLEDPNKLMRRFYQLFKDGIPTKRLREVQFFLLSEVLPLSPRVGEAFAVELIRHVPGILTEIGGPNSPIVPEDLATKPGELLERALFQAANYDQRELVQQLLDVFLQLLKRLKPNHRLALTGTVTRQSLASLKKLGMRDEIDRLLHSLQSEILQGGSFQQLQQRYSSNLDDLCLAQQTLLSIAAGWLSYGSTKEAESIFEEVRKDFLVNIRPQYSVLQSTALACAYISAIGHSSATVAIPAMLAFFENFDLSIITNKLTTSLHYSRLHLKIVEEVVLTLIQDSFALGPAGRRWLDDDEYLVRKRIHADMQKERERHGF